MSSECDGEACLHDVRLEVRETVDAAVAAEHATIEMLVGLRQELSTPLSAIIGLAQVMRDEGLGPLDNSLQRYCLDDIDACAQHLAGLIDQIVARAMGTELSSAA